MIKFNRNKITEAKHIPYAHLIPNSYYRQEREITIEDIYDDVVLCIESKYKTAGVCYSYSIKTQKDQFSTITTFAFLFIVNDVDFCLSIDYVILNINGDYNLVINLMTHYAFEIYNDLKVSIDMNGLSRNASLERITDIIRDDTLLKQFASLSFNIEYKDIVGVNIHQNGLYIIVRHKTNNYTINDIINTRSITRFSDQYYIVFQDEYDKMFSTYDFEEFSNLDFNNYFSDNNNISDLVGNCNNSIRLNNFEREDDGTVSYVARRKSRPNGNTIFKPIRKFGITFHPRLIRFPFIERLCLISRCKNLKAEAEFSFCHINIENSANITILCELMKGCKFNNVQGLSIMYIVLILNVEIKNCQILVNKHNGRTSIKNTKCNDSNIKFHSKDHIFILKSLFNNCKIESLTYDVSCWINNTFENCLLLVSMTDRSRFNIYNTVINCRYI